MITCLQVDLFGGHCFSRLADLHPADRAGAQRGVMESHSQSFTRGLDL